MEIAFLILGLFLLLVLCIIAKNQVEQARNQVSLSKTLKQIESNTNRTANETEKYNKAYHI